MAETIDKILEKLPYSDGSLRRRFVSGGIVLVGIFFICIVFFDIEKIKSLIGNFTIKDLLTSPILAGVLILFVYALGNLVEMFGEIFLLRAASGVFWALCFPTRCMFPKHYTTLRFLFRLFLWTSVVPYLMILDMIRGLFGYTPYKTQIESFLSEEAKEIFTSLPNKVVSGLSQPVGENAEIAWKHVVEQFNSETDQKWARRSITRIKDISSVTTALIIIFISVTFITIFKEKTYDLQTRLNIVDNVNRHADNINRQMEDISNKIMNTSEQEIMNSNKQLKDVEIKLGELILERSKRTAKRTAIIIGVTAIFMPLYVAFFVSLRNTIVSILEILAIKKMSPVEKK